MGDDACVRYLAEFIYVKKFIITEEMTSPNYPLSAYLLMNEFVPKLFSVLLTRHKILCLKWCQKFDTFTDTCDMNTHEEYLRSIILACFNEHYSYQKVFDSFINVCSYVRYFCLETSQKKGKNYDYLNFDIFMEFYDRVLKRSFRRCGGLQRFAKYILNHEYLAWNLDLAHLVDPSIPPDAGMADKLEKLFDEERKILQSNKPKTDLIQKSIDYITQKVLSATSAELPALPGKQNSDQTASASASNDKAETAEGKKTFELDVKFEHLKEASPGCSNSNSEINQDPQQKEDIVCCESIIQAVMRYNHSKASGPVTSDKRLQKAEGILKHLKDTIESLIEVLDEYDKE